LPEAARLPVEVSDTKSPEHGDFACNFALVATKKAGMPPRQIGELLKEELLKAPSSSSRDTTPAESASPVREDDEEGVGGGESQTLFESIDIAGPGFLNLRLKPEAISSYIPQVLALGTNLPNAKTPQRPEATRINVEFVSVNPNGPITVGSGRGAAFGDTLSRVLVAAGSQVDREYYINDGVNSEQMRLFAESVKSYVEGKPLPEKGYKGEYVQDVAKQVAEQPDAAAQDVNWFQRMSQDLMIERQRGDLALFGVEFQRWFSEQSLHDEKKVEAAMQKLEAAGNAYRSSKPADAEEDDPNPQPEIQNPKSGEALWLASASKEFGDDKDRVLVRADGRPAYIAADVAYLEDKLGTRGYDKAFLILGPDHHGYIGRLYAVYQALGYPMRADGKPEKFEIIIFQLVRFVKEGKPAPMRKRDGNIYELRDLINELGENVAPQASKEEQQRIGADVARFFYLMRSHDSSMDFDIDLATKQSDENPVFYAQYAHARICSVLAKAREAGITVSGSSGIAGEGNTATPQHPNTGLLTHPRELTLVKKILDLPWEVRRCAQDYGVHRLTTYAVELARTYHHFYDACRVIQPDQPELSQARVALCQAARIALKATFDLLGVSAPERMDRTEAIA